MTHPVRQWTPSPSRPSPDARTGVVGWLKENLFSSWGNTVLTIIAVAILAILIPPFIKWTLIESTWIGESRQVCDQAAANGQAGACWVFVNVRLDMFLYGFYPEAERWRINFVMLTLAFLMLPLLMPETLKNTSRQAVIAVIGSVCAMVLFGFIAGIIFTAFMAVPFLLAVLSHSNINTFTTSRGGTGMIMGAGIGIIVGIIVSFLAETAGGENVAPLIGCSVAFTTALLFIARRLSLNLWRWTVLFTVFPVLAYVMLIGDAFGLMLVETHFWGGLFLTLVVAGTGMATALPIGILLALGRRSTLPVIRTVCIAFIEFARGVPLVSVLFMASVMFPLFLPHEMNFDKLLRALIGIAFFYAAYMAEVVRGGLQAIPKGQYEAANALGWTYWPTMSMIILPQTLRLIIPGLTNNFLSLLKDTTLVAVIGMLDLLGIAKAAMADTEWLGFTKEAYIFAAVVFWVFCFGLSRYSVHLERKYHTNYN